VVERHCCVALVAVSLYQTTAPISAGEVEAWWGWGGVERCFNCPSALLFSIVLEALSRSPLRAESLQPVICVGAEVNL
jgi:hypothetical protein